MAALDRVLTRLALTTEKNVPKVIEKLLPAVIAELNLQNNLVLQKVIEILSHVNKVLSGQTEIKIPVEALIQVCQGDNASQVTRSYALMYVEKGFLRETKDVQIALPGDLLTAGSLLEPVRACFLDQNISPSRESGLRPSWSARPHQPAA